MEIFLFIFYLLLFSTIIYKYHVYRYFGLSPLAVLILFWIKVVAGCGYVFIHQYYYGGGDILRFHKNAKWVMYALHQNPIHYLKLVFGFYNGVIPADLAPYIKHFTFWKDNGTYLLVRVLALFNLFSNGNMYINSIFWELFSMIGLLSLYKIFYFYFPTKKTLLLLCVFAVPSTLFWSSGIHKDGIILTCTGLLFMCANDLVVKQFHWIKLLISTLCMLILLMIRGYEPMIMMPGLVALYWCYKQPKNKFFKFLFVYGNCIVLFFVTDTLFHLGFINFILQKQQLFLFYGSGNSFLRPLMINKSWQSFVLTAPHALYRALFRPNIFQYHSIHELGYAIVHSLFLITCFGLLFFVDYKKRKVSALALFCIFYALLIFIFIGWTVPNTGAMVRYTSCALPFFTLFFVLIADEKKINKLPFIKKRHLLFKAK